MFCRGTVINKYNYGDLGLEKLSPEYGAGICVGLGSFDCQWVGLSDAALNRRISCQRAVAHSS